MYKLIFCKTGGKQLKFWNPSPGSQILWFFLQNDQKEDAEPKPEPDGVNNQDMVDHITDVERKSKARLEQSHVKVQDVEQRQG